MMAKTKPQSRVSVADYISQQIVLSGKSQKDIAEELGYEKHNIITMFKQGKTKVPINKVAIFAKALGVDPVHFLRIALMEYSPATWEVLEGILGNSLISENELNILSIIRGASGGEDIGPSTEEEVKELTDLAAKWKSKVDASIATAQNTVRVKVK